MTSQRENHDVSDYRGNLVEFEHASATSLAQIEDACTTILDEYVYGSSGLEEIENSMETVLLDETVEDEPSEPEKEKEEPPSEEEPGEEEVEEPKDITEEPEEGLIEEEPEEPEKEPEEPPEPPPEPENPVIGFICRHALDVNAVADEDGVMTEHPLVRLIELPCAGMVKPEWLKDVLEKGMSGVFVVSCRETSCAHRRGAEITKERMEGKRRPIIAGKFERGRFRLWEFHPLDREEFMTELAKFIRDIGILDSESTEEPSD